MNTSRSTLIRLSHWIGLSLTLLLLPSVAQAECDGRWGLIGGWSFNQDNGIAAAFDLREHPIPDFGWGGRREIIGFASYDAIGSPPTGTPNAQKGTVEGYFTAKDVFQLRVSWNNGNVGVYEGTVDSDGGISGRTYDLKHSVSASWRGDRNAKCVTALRCESGLVWRESFDGDVACVRSDERYRLDNGACRTGYVWRDTFNGDNVCVIPAERDAAKAQKRRDDLDEVTNRPGASDLKK